MRTSAVWPRVHVERISNSIPTGKTNSNPITVLGELEHHGAMHDASEPDWGHRMLNITPETGALLGIRFRAMRAQNILELEQSYRGIGSRNLQPETW